MRASPRSDFCRLVLGTRELPVWLRDGWRIEEVAPEHDRFLVRAAHDEAAFVLGARREGLGLALTLEKGSARGPKPLLRVGLERVGRALRAGRATPAVWARPTQAVFFLTDVCNLRCTYCVVPFGGNTLSRARIDRAFELLADEPAPTFTMLGGEPTLAWDKVQYVAETARAQHPDASICMVTNGTQITPDRAAWAASLGMDITVSLDGDLESHAGRRVGAMNTSHDRAVELYHQAVVGIRHLLDAGLALRGNMVVTPATVEALGANARHLFALGLDTISVSPAVGVRWPGDSVERLEEGLDSYGAVVLEELAGADSERRQRTRIALQWELRRAWYFLGEGVFHPFARRVVFGADGRLFSDLYNHEIAGELYLGEMDAIESLDELAEHRTTTPQASYVAAGWSDEVLEDVRGISRVQLERLARLDAAFDTLFPGTCGARELLGHAPLHG